MNVFGKRVWGHSQNLSEDGGSRVWNGRGWLNIDGTALGIEWHFGRRHVNFFHLGLTLNGHEDEVVFSVGVPFLFSIYFSIEGRWLGKRLPGEWKDSTLEPGKRWFCPTEREIGIRISDGFIWISLWRNPMEWNSDDPWWWEFSFFPADFFLGRGRRRMEELRSGRVIVDLPEGQYWASYCLYDSVWKRSRWPWPKRIRKVTIDPDVPIPVPGKGENSWDCDDDAVFSLTCPAKSGQEAAERLVESIMETRGRYGGPRWAPIREDGDDERKSAL